MPSAYLMTDVWIYLDKLLDRKLFKPTPDQSRMSLAGVEGLKMKKLVGALRALWRSSKEFGSDERITDLKSFLRASPSPQRGPPSDDERAGSDSPGPDEAASDPESTSDNDHDPIEDDEPLPDHADADPIEDAESMEGGDDGEPVDGDGESIDGESIHGDESQAGESCPASAEELPEASCAHGDPPAQDAGASQDSLIAPTLKLGGSDSSSQCSQSEEEAVVSSEEGEQEEEEWRDSQVSSGWLGKALLQPDGKGGEEGGIFGHPLGRNSP